MQDDEPNHPRVHTCKELPETGVHIHFGRYLAGRPQCWSLYLVREATKEDLESNDALEDVGDSIWSVYHEITFCPHCGAKLLAPTGLDSDEPQEENHLAPYGPFSLFDQQNWHGVLR